MWTNRLKVPVLSGRCSVVDDWWRGVKCAIAFLLAACDPRIGRSPGDEGAIAWLNGLRGVAAFIVYCHHHVMFTPHANVDGLWHQFGYDGQYYFAALPFIRFLFVGGGTIAVALFFTISGFVLSYGSLRTIQSRPDGTDHELATRIGTAVARRWLRLFLPVMVTTFVFMASWHLFGIQSAQLNSAAPTETFLQEATRWLKEFIYNSYVFHTRDVFARNDYNMHMWSIAVEYRGSLLVYIWVLAMFAIDYSAIARFYCALALFFYFQLLVNGHFYAGFIMGVLIGDLTIVAEIDPSQLPKMFRLRLFRQGSWVYYALFLAGGYLGGVSQVHSVVELQKEPGWYWLSAFIPASLEEVAWYYAIFGAALMVISIPNIRWLKRFFESRAAQYLGKISFGLYLIHGPLMWTVGDRLYAAFGAPHYQAELRIQEWINRLPLSDRGIVGMEMNHLVAQIVLLPLSLWMAVAVTNLVDTPSVQLSKYIFATRKEKETEKTGRLLPR